MQKAFDKIKEALINPPILVPPMPGRSLKLYISVAEESIDYLLAQGDENSVERAIYYLTRLLNETETRYVLLLKNYICHCIMLVQNSNIICCLEK